MGNNRISQLSVSPKEKKLRDSGFSSFISSVIKCCNENNIEFVYNSYSPSAYAVKKGPEKKENLRQWLKTNLYI
jgi:hypothetical protein